MIVRAIPSDLPLLEPCAREFHAASSALGAFNLSQFIFIWAQLIADGMGVIFIDIERENIAGAIGGIVRKDLYSGNPSDLTAEECFWFVREGQRGVGVELYRRFEAHARAKGAKSIQMVHLLDLMPSKVSRFYLSEGYEPIETRYSKKL